MSTTKASRTLTVRLSPQLYSAAQDLASKKHVSLNALMQESLTEAIRAAEEKIRYDGYTMLGQDSENCDLGYAEAAQGEVMLRDE